MPSPGFSFHLKIISISTSGGKSTSSSSTQSPVDGVAVTSSFLIRRRHRTSLCQLFHWPVWEEPHKRLLGQRV